MLPGLCIPLGDRSPKASTWGLQTLQLVKNVQFVTKTQAGARCAGSTFKWDSTDSELHIPCGRHIQAKYWAGSWSSRLTLWLLQVEFRGGKWSHRATALKHFLDKRSPHLTPLHDITSRISSTSSPLVREREREGPSIKPFVPDFPLTYAWRCPAQEPDSLCSLCHTIHGPLTWQLLNQIYHQYILIGSQTEF